MEADVFALQEEVSALRRVVSEQARRLATWSGSSGNEQNYRCSDSQSLSSMLCSTFARNEPQVAVCISGIARAFVQSLVYRSFKAHVLDAIGAPVTAFARLKLEDARYMGRRVSVSREAVLRALAAVGIPLERTVLLNHSSHSFADCEEYSTDSIGRQRHNRTVSSGALCSANYLHAAVGQMESRYFGVQLVERYENRTGTRFDWVLFARPDLLWYRPLRPWCFFATKRTTLTAVAVIDFAFLLPRAKVVPVLQAPHLRYHSCTEDLPRCKTLEHYQRGAWKAVGVYPIQQHPSGLPAMIPRPGSHSRMGSYTCASFLRVAEQQAWEPNLLGRQVCNSITNFNKCLEGPPDR